MLVLDFILSNKQKGEIAAIIQDQLEGYLSAYLKVGMRSEIFNYFCIKR